MIKFNIRNFSKIRNAIDIITILNHILKTKL